MPNTTWSTTDKSANITLSGGNLVATTSSFPAQGVRAVHPQVSGKYYFEITLTTSGSNTNLFGLANLSADLAGAGATPTNSVGVFGNTGTIFLNGANTSITLGARATGDIIGIAVDLDNSLIWFRVAPSGNWNANAGFAPGGTGGVSLSSIFNALTPLRPYWSCSVFGGGAVTANFGDTAFSGTVPAGYTSGWPTSALTNVAAATQVSVEQWADSNPDAQISQLAVEQWSSSFALSGNAIVSQVAVEEWGVYAAASTGRKRRQVSVAT